MHSTNSNPRTFEQRFGHNNWRKYGGFCKAMETEEEILCCRDNSEIPKENYNINSCVCVCINKLLVKRYCM